MRKSSVVGHAIELTCSAVTHEAQTAVAAISGYRRARWHAFSQRRVRDARVRPNTLWIDPPLWTRLIPASPALLFSLRTALNETRDPFL